MTPREIFKIWAPANSKWSPWVRPTPFIGMPEIDTLPPHFSLSTPPFLTLYPPIFSTKKPDFDTALILDLPSAESISAGLTLAQSGYFPVPLYNGTTPQHGAMALVDNSAIQNALIFGATELAKIEIPDTAPPVFLLDSNRRNRCKMNVSVFDNSWDIYAQDMPSSDFLKAQKIKQVLVISDFIHKDLSKILYDYQKAGLKVLHSDGFCEPKRVRIRKPPRKYR